MRRPALLGFLFILLLFLSLSTCMKTPSNPSENPMNVSLNLFSPDEDNTAKAGIPKQLCLEVVLPQHITEIRLVSSCGDVDTVIILSSESQTDTISLSPVFDNEGTCTLTVTAELVDNRIKEKTDKLVLHVLPGIPTLTFSDTPVAFITHTGISDTLRFVTGTSQVNNINFEVSSNPTLDSGEMHLIEPVADDTVLVCFGPSEAGTYTVTLTATADTLAATASVTVTVLSSFTPLETDNPQTLITGTADTLVYTLTNKQIANGITMELLDAENLPGIVTIIPSGSDSLFIAVTPDDEGTLTFSIATTNGELTDTTDYAFTIVNASDVVWSGTSVSVDATEGAEKTVDLTYYFFTGVNLDDITFDAEAGSIDNNGIWHFTPSWGGEATQTIIITGKLGDKDQDLTISLTVAPGDDTDPSITLLFPATESKTVSSSQATVSVNVTDAGAGVDHVTFVTSDTTINGTKENDSTFSAVISGLMEGPATDVIITATDGSMKKNNSTKTISFTYDPTMEDGDAPVFSLVEGPQNGDRVTTATGTTTWDISDDSGVDSVWWTLNDEFVSAISASGNGEYTISYEFSDFGDNTIRLYAKDGSGSANEGSRTVTLTYNTELTAIVLTAPEDNESGVSTSPTFEWSGGDDTDGDGVIFVLSYGTTQSSLTETATVSGKTATVSSTLACNTTYFWRVTGTSTSSEFHDEVQSDVFEFHTEGSLPEISTHPQSQTIEEEQNVTFSMTASGFGTLEYQWRENGSDISGANSSSYSITSVTMAMDDNTYDCVVSNEVGNITSNPATLTVTSVPVYTVSFDMHGGDPIEDQSVERDGYAQEPATPERDGYTFGGIIFRL